MAPQLLQMLPSAPITQPVPVPWQGVLPPQHGWPGAPQVWQEPTIVMFRPAQPRAI